MTSLRTSALLVIALCAWCTTAQATPKRDHRATAEFKRTQPCPATGKARGACPGWVIDHVKPLACGGPDHPSNLQWQTTTDAKAKDKWERRGCRRF